METTEEAEAAASQFYRYCGPNNYSGKSEAGPMWRICYMSDIGFVMNKLGLPGQEHPLWVTTVVLPREMNVSRDFDRRRDYNRDRDRDRDRRHGGDYDRGRYDDRERY